MKYKINYSKQGSEEIIDKLCVYIEKWKKRKQRNVSSVPISNITYKRPRNINRVSSFEDKQAHKAIQEHAYAAYAPRKEAPAQKARNQQVRKSTPSAKRQRQPQKTSNIKRNLSRVGISVLTFLLALVFIVLCADILVLHGPSKAARDRFVLTVTETSAAGFLATWFLPDETVNKIIEDNAVIDVDGQTDPTLIKLPGSDNGNEGDNPGTDVDINSVELINIEGKTYKGKLLIVQNPKRVYIGTPVAYGNDKEGVTTLNMVKNDNALYGINGGGFYDTGKGNGGIPTGRENSDGIVISKGVLMFGVKNQEYEVIGINKQGILVLGKMTAQQALDNGIVEALNFGPYLVMNGKACEVGGFTEAGLNPRSAIGQRADGAMLILTIDGRQPSSMGATYEDLIEIMMNYGAVNAANLDGGSSTYMAQNSETGNNPQIITQCASLYGPRKMATSILVSRVDQINTQYEQNG